MPAFFLFLNCAAEVYRRCDMPSRALDCLMHNCSFVDASGRALDAEVLLGHDHDRSEPTEKETSGAEASGDENTGDDR
jgi:hypothetical protein